MNTNEHELKESGVSAEGAESAGNAWICDRCGTENDDCDMHCFMCMAERL